MLPGTGGSPSAEQQMRWRVPQEVEAVSAPEVLVEEFGAGEDQGQDWSRATKPTEVPQTRAISEHMFITWQSLGTEIICTSCPEKQCAEMGQGVRGRWGEV